MSAGRIAMIAAPYLAALVPLALTLFVHGVDALRYDGHPLQRWEALLLLWLGVEAFRRGELGEWERLLAGSGAAWLCVDELLMVHECAKWKWQLGGLGDPLIVLYVAAALAVGARVLWVHPARRAAAPHLMIAVAAALLAASADIAHASPLLEESGELVAIAAALAAVRAAPGSAFLPAAGWVALQVAWMGAAVWLVRPWLCPARLL